MALDVRNLTVVYHRVALAVEGISLHVPAGGIVALLGTNGAGKTTTLQAIAGFLDADDIQVTKGTVEYRGQRLDGQAPEEIARHGIVLVPEREKIFETLSVEDNLRIGLGIARAGAPTLEEAYGYFPTLRERRGQLAGYLSGGERQMLALASALVCGPEVLLVDELSLGLAPRVVEDLLERLRQLRDERGIAVLLVEQNVSAALSICDHAYILETGRIVLEGSPEELLEHPDVRQFYLGWGTAREAKSYRDVKQYRRKRRWFG